MSVEGNFEGCPKAMVFGPCGGVRTDGSCEVDQRPCPFLRAYDLPTVDRPAVRPELRIPVPTIVVDVRAPAHWRGDHEQLWRATGEALAGCVALLGEHVDNSATDDDSGMLDATRVISILRDAGAEVIATITGRDRNLTDAAKLIRRYSDAGVSAIHCVTGDHPAAIGIERSARFGAEAMTLIAAAVDAGTPATVGESPASPGRRSERLAAKELAGATACILNHSGATGELVAFADECRAAGVAMPLVAPVPMVSDRRAALGLAAFPGLRLAPGYLDRLVEAAHPEQEGLAASRQITRACASSGRFAGINLSGSAGGTDPWERLRTTIRFVEAAKSELARSSSESLTE